MKKSVLYGPWFSSRALPYSLKEKNFCQAEVRSADFGFRMPLGQELINTKWFEGIKRLGASGATPGG